MGSATQHNVLNKYRLPFDETLDTWKNIVYIEPQPDEKLYHSKPWPVQRVQKLVFNKEVEIFLKMGFIWKLDRPE